MVANMRYVNSGRDSVILILTHFWQFQSTEHGFELLLMSIRSRFVVLCFRNENSSGMSLFIIYDICIFRNIQPKLHK